MTNIKVWLQTSCEPLIFTDVEEFHESRHVLEIIQEEMYTTTTTRIYKPNIIRYTIHDKRC